MMGETYGSGACQVSSVGCFRKPHLQPFGGTIGPRAARWDRSPLLACRIFGRAQRRREPCKRRGAPAPPRHRAPPSLRQPVFPGPSRFSAGPSSARARLELLSRRCARWAWCIPRHLCAQCPLAFVTLVGGIAGWVTPWESTGKSPLGPLRPESLRTLLV
jgi:hypothetical protein